jgi:hypothetical protein
MVAIRRLAKRIEGGLTAKRTLRPSTPMKFGSEVETALDWVAFRKGFGN